MFFGTTLPFLLQQKLKWFIDFDFYISKWTEINKCWQLLEVLEMKPLANVRLGLRRLLLSKWEIRQHSNVHTNKLCEEGVEPYFGGERKQNKQSNISQKYTSNTLPHPSQIETKNNNKTAQGDHNKMEQKYWPPLNINTSPFHSTTKWTQSRWECVAAKTGNQRTLLSWASMFAPFKWEIWQLSNVHSNKRVKGSPWTILWRRKETKQHQSKNTIKHLCHIHLKSKQRTTTKNSSRRSQHSTKIADANKWTQFPLKQRNGNRVAVSAKLEINELLSWLQCFAPFRTWESPFSATFKCTHSHKRRWRVSNHAMEEKGNKTNKATSVKNTHQTHCHIHRRNRNKNEQYCTSWKMGSLEQGKSHTLNINTSCPRDVTKSRWECVNSKLVEWNKTKILTMRSSPFKWNVRSKLINTNSVLGFNILWPFKSTTKWTYKETMETKQGKHKTAKWTNFVWGFNVRPFQDEEFGNIHNVRRTSKVKGSLTIILWRRREMKTKESNISQKSKWNTLSHPSQIEMKNNNNNNQQLQRKRNKNISSCL